MSRTINDTVQDGEEEEEEEEEDEQEEDEDEDDEDRDDDEEHDEGVAEASKVGNKRGQREVIRGRKKSRSTSKGDVSRKKTAEFTGYLEATYQNMLDANIRYSHPYFSAELTDETKGYYFCYVMNVGFPSDPNKEPTKRKSSTAYFGLSDTDGNAIERVALHNDKNAAGSKMSKTRPSAGRWVLCMVIFLPPEFRQYASAWLPHDYGEVAHGFSGKIKRAFTLVQLFNFRFFVVKEHIEAVKEVIECIDTYDHKKNNFYPLQIKN